MHVRIGSYSELSTHELAHKIFGNPSYKKDGELSKKYRLADRLGDWLQGDPDNPSWFAKILKFLTKREIYVHIDDYDVWNMDDTLKHIIHPMLIKLRDIKQGSGMIDDCDVPDELKSTAPGARDGILEDWECDHNLHRRYEWVLSEMIWAFDPSTQEPEYNTSKQYRSDLEAYVVRLQKAQLLFGKYYCTLWN